MGVAAIFLQTVIMATICLQTVIYTSGRGSLKKQSYAMTCSNTSTFNLACGVRPK